MHALPLKHNPLLLIDANLAERPLAQALRLVDYNAEAVSDKFGQGAPDPIIIQWLGLQGGVWVTADEHAKREHAEEIKAAGIHILWVRRPKKQGFSKKAQLLLLLWIADDVLNHIAGAKNPAQFLAQYSGQRPKVVKL